MMTSIIEGIKKAARLKKMIGILYLANLLSAAAIMFPFKRMLEGFAGNSLMGKSLSEGLNADFLFEFLMNNSAGMKTIGSLIVFMACLYWAIELFLSGGLFSIVLGKDGWSSSAFWGNSARYFGRFLRVWLFSVPVFLILYGVQFIVPLAKQLFFGSDPYEYVTFWAGVIQTGIGYIGIIAYFVVFDWSRMYVIVNDERKALKAVSKTLKAVSRKIVKPFSLAGAVVLLGILSLFLYREFAGSFSGSSIFMIGLLIVTQQAYMVLKIGCNVAYYASIAEMYHAIMPQEPLEVPEPVLPPSSEENLPALDATI